MLKGFREFVARGNVVDMAVGIIMGAAFGAIVQSLVKDIIMPAVGLVRGRDFTDFFIVLKPGGTPGPYADLRTAQALHAVTMNYGVFINQIITFLIVAFAVFLLVKSVNRVRRPAEAPPARECPYCFSPLALQATRCPHCTSEVAPPAA